MEKTIIYTDGACLNNGNNGAGGWAFIVLLDEKGEYSESRKILEATNNVAELIAIERAVDYSIAKGLKSIVIYSDSKYAIGCLTQWWMKWKSDGWKKKGGIKNLELIKTVLDKINNLDSFEMKWVKAHSGVHYNEKADQLAEKAASSGYGESTSPQYIPPRNEPKEQHAVEFLMWYTNMNKRQAENSYNRFINNSAPS